jgi:MSHA biogenesis protein MshJ
LPVTSKRPGDAKTSESGAEAANGKRADSSTAAAGAESESAEGTVYSHGVEIVVQGGYLEMLNYMNELEQMPWHVFWGNATLKVDEYPQATLTLTLYTMSLNRKWLNL